MIKLTLAEGLPKVWAAFNDGSLQAGKAQTNPSSAPTTGCYVGPCAIGVMMTPEERVKADHSGVSGSFMYASLDVLAMRGIAQFPSCEEEYDAQMLQGAHDAWLAHPLNKQKLDHFVLTLTNLSTKYPEATAS